jgi:hypothetical protein
MSSSACTLSRAVNFYAKSKVTDFDRWNREHGVKGASPKVGPAD